jgi:CHASE3 domain sensor protein
MILASGLLALIVGAVFAILLVAIQDLRSSGRQATQSRTVLAAADNLEKLVIDLETGVRGFVITGQERFLQPWTAARAAFPEQSRNLVSSVDDPVQASRARRIALSGESYIRDYSVPLVRAVRRDEPSASSIATTAEGKRRIDALRAQFDRFTATERAQITARQDSADSDASRAIAIGIGARGIRPSDHSLRCLPDPGRGPPHSARSRRGRPACRRRPGGENAHYRGG